MVGNLYDAPEYSAKRDTAFSLFYMAINIGALFAPTAATAMTNYVLGKAGFSAPQIPSLAHQFLDGTITAEGEATLTAMQSAQNFTGSMADSVLPILINCQKPIIMVLVWHVSH